MDEIKSFQSARWISPPEAMWRIYGFDLNEMHPSVKTFPVHLKDQQPLTFPENQSLDNIAGNPIAKKTMLTEFFYMNRYNSDAQALKCVYTDFPQYFVWYSQAKSGL